MKLKDVGGVDATGREAKADRAAALQNVRKVSLGANTFGDGTAEYKMLLTSAGLDRAIAIEKEMPKADELLKRARLAGHWPAASDARLVLTGYPQLPLANMRAHAGAPDVMRRPLLSDCGVEGVEQGASLR